jgi:hypothetical protein
MMRDFYGMLVASLLIVGSASTSSVAHPPVYSDVKKGYLDKLAASKTPIFIASCAAPEKKFLAIIPIGAAEGKFVELSWSNGYTLDPALVNIATFVIFGQADLRDMMQGGLGTRQLNEETLRYLIRQPFTLVLPSQFGAIVGLQPATKCVPDRD